MQIKMRRLFFVFLALVSLCSWSTLVACADEETYEKIAINLRDAKTEDERLKICLAAIDRGYIHAGLSASQVDDMFGTSFSRENKGAQKGDDIAFYTMRDGEFSWRLTFYFNERGELFGYYLTNVNQKGNVPPSKASADFDQISKKFHEALTSSQKVSCAIEAIDSGAINKSTSSKKLSEIFGKCSSKKRVSSHGEVRTYAFANASNSWRFTCFGNDSGMFDYFLTNIDCEPWGVKHWGLN